MNLHFKQILYNLNKYLFIFLTLKIVQGHQHQHKCAKLNQRYYHELVWPQWMVFKVVGW